MYPDNAAILSASAKKFTVYTIMLAAFGVFVFFVFFLPGRLLYDERKYFYFLIFPIVAVLVGASVKAFVNSYFVGRWAGLCASLILYFSNGLSVVLFLTFVTDDMKYLTAIVWVFLFAAAIIICKASVFFYTGIYDGCSIKAFSYALVGIAINRMFSGMKVDE